MLRLLIIAGVFAAVFCDDKPCCPPEQWEGIQAGRGGVLADGKPEILTMNMNVAVDRQQQLVYSFVNTTSGNVFNSQKIYQDYKQNVQYAYDVMKKTCAKSTVAQQFYDGCLPPQSKYMGAFIMGAGSESVMVKSYTLHTDQAGTILDAEVTVTADQCVPIGENVVGSAHNFPMTISYGFVNVNIGIRDPSIFNPPAVCKQNATHVDAQFQHHLSIF